MSEVPGNVFLMREAPLCQAAALAHVLPQILCENRFNSKTIFKAILATLERII